MRAIHNSRDSAASSSDSQSSRSANSSQSAQSKALRISPGSARSLLLTLLGEFILPSQKAAWTAPMVYTLAGLGVADKAARQAIARAGAAGWIESERDGRRTAWRISARGRQLITAGSQRIRSLYSNPDEWDGTWMLLHISLPTSRRGDRLRLYRALSWIGFGNPNPGVWICPHAHRADEARRVIAAMHLSEHTLAWTSRSLDFGLPLPQLVARAWDLARVAEYYHALVKRFSAIHPRTDDAVLFAHVELVNALQRLPSVDPGLPHALLPPKWDSDQQAKKLIALRHAWHDQAHARWRELSAELVGQPARRIPRA